MKKRATVAICGGLALALALVSLVSVKAFDPQPDPPVFGLISVRPGEVLQMHVVCSEHGAGRVGPRTCAGEVMFHDRAGNVLDRQTYRLAPGQAATFDYRLPGAGVAFGDGSVRVGIVPCVIPNPLGGRSLPTVELADLESGRTLLYAGPIAPRLTLFSALAPEGR